ncbi:phage holin family protein [Luteimonas aestuarii]|uniref:phage holin family protein n=1 Tax=Luteimonas aestuarii TaxID=453837 RepID=UPI0026C0C43B
MTGETPPTSTGAQAHDDAGTRKPASFDESVRAIGAEGRATLDSALDTGRALRRLASADFALARSALGRGLAWTAVAVVFGASAWLLLMGAMIALMQAFGFSWLASISSAAFISLAVAGLAAWRVSVFFDMAGMHATRRALSQLGLFNEAGEDDEDDGAAPVATGTTGKGAA